MVATVTKKGLPEEKTPKQNTTILLSDVNRGVGGGVKRSGPIESRERVD